MGWNLVLWFFFLNKKKINNCAVGTTKNLVFSHIQLATWMRVIHVANCYPRAVSHVVNPIVA